MASPASEVIDPSADFEAPLPEVGEILGEYRLTEVIGQGAMGRVYRARHLILGQDYALKVMGAHHAAPAVREERFLREARATARINHPNVVRVLYSGLTEQGQIYLVMELLNGRPLASLLSERPMEPVRAARIVQQIARGLAAIHGLGLLHRDIKPSNVIIEEREGEDRVKILDLGLVGYVDPEPNVRITQHGHLMGTPIYMAPEALSLAHYSAQSDLYSLGALFYEMLAGQPPFDGTLREVIRHHQTTAPPLLPGSHGLDEVVYQLLEKEPGRRPRDAEALEQEIDRRLAKTKAALALEDTPRKLRRSVGRHLRATRDGHDWVRSGAAFVTALVVTSAFWWAVVVRDEPEVVPLRVGPKPSPLRVPPAVISLTTTTSTPTGATADPGGPVRNSKGRPPSPGPKGRLSPRARASADQVEVSILSIPPGATVEMDQGRLGLTPLVVAVPGGRRIALRLLKEGYQPGHLTFFAGRGKDRLRVRLRPEAHR